MRRLDYFLNISFMFMDAYCSDDLPESLSLISKSIGFDATVALIKLSAGRRLYIPKNLKSKHSLIEALGLEAAQKLCKEFGGQIIAIPMAISMIRAARNREIIKKRDGTSVSKLAANHHLSERQIWKIIKEGGTNAKAGRC